MSLLFSRFWPVFHLPSGLPSFFGHTLCSLIHSSFLAPPPWEALLLMEHALQLVVMVVGRLKVLWRSKEAGNIGVISQGGSLHILASLGCLNTSPSLPCSPFTIHLLFFSVLEPSSSISPDLLSSIPPSTPSLYSSLLPIYLLNCPTPLS